MIIDLRRILRSLRRAPGFTAVVVLTLALAIGANTAIFSLVDAALLRPLPFPAADRLVAVWEQTDLFGLRYSPVAFANYVDWRAQNRTFAEMGLYERSSAVLTGDAAEEVACGLVSASLFRALQVLPTIGRFWNEGEDLAGAAKTVVLSHRLWQHRFAGASDIVGQRLRINGEAYTVIGVMPPGFAIPEQDDALWLPLGSRYPATEWANRDRHNYFVAGRLAPGVPLARANADLASIAARLQQEHPGTNSKLGTFASPLSEHVSGKVRTLYLVLVGAVALLLLTACANLANLMLVRLVGRSQETAVRLALGAGLRHLLRHALLEAGVLGLLGGVAGLLVACWSMNLLQPLIPAELAPLAPVRLDWPLLGFATATTLLASLLIACASLWPIVRRSALATLRQGGGRTGTAGPARRFQSGLIVAQLACSLTLVVGAGLLVRTFQSLRSTELGFRREQVVVARLSGIAVWNHYSRDRAGLLAFYHEALRRVESLPGVAAAGFTNGIPLLMKGNMWEFVPEQQANTARPGEALSVNYRVVSPGYLSALGLPLLSGRRLAATDTADRPLVAVVNRAFAGKLWPTLAEVVGQRVRSGNGQWVTVVGVVGDMRQTKVDQLATPEIYFSWEQQWEAATQIAIRTTTPPQVFAPLLRAELAAAAPDVPLVECTTLDHVVDHELAPRRLQTALLGAFAGLALLVAAIGLHGVVAYSVAQRTREFGIRAALGATRADILAQVARENLRLLLPGLGAGITLALLLTRLIRGLLYEVAPYDLPSFAVAVGLLLGSGLLAAWLPARRATRIDPALALRGD